MDTSDRLMSGDVFSLSRSATDQFAHDDDTLSRVVTTDSNSKSSNSRGNRNLRVFMSSTFSDMSEERHALAKYVFPQVKYYYEDRGLIFSDIDLKWGVPAENDPNIVTKCLDLLNECNNNVIIFLGQRYGWIPGNSPRSIAADAGHRWVENHLECSITELEIRSTILNHPSYIHKDGFDENTEPKRSERGQIAYIFIRDSSYLDIVKERLETEPTPTALDQHIAPTKPTKIEEMIDAIPESLEKLNHLIKEIEEFVRNENNFIDYLNRRNINHNIPYIMLRYYKNPMEICPIILENLENFIPQLEKSSRNPNETIRYPLNPYETVRYLHIQRCKEKVKSFLEDKDKTIIDELDGYLLKPLSVSMKPHILIGNSGSGKSSLLSHWYLEFKRLQDSNCMNNNLYQNTLCMIHSFQHSEGDAVGNFVFRVSYEVRKFLKISPTGAIPTTCSSPSSSSINQSLSLVSSNEDEDSEDIQLLTQNFSTSSFYQKKLRLLFSQFDIANAEKYFILLIDGIDELQDTQLRELLWFPSSDMIPSNVRIVFTTTSTGILSSFKDWKTIEIPLLSPEYKTNLIEKSLTTFHRQKFSQEQQDLIKNAPQTESPLYLSLLLTELRITGVYEKITAQIEKLLKKRDVRELYDSILHRLEGSYEEFDNEMPWLVSTFFLYLYHSNGCIRVSHVRELLHQTKHFDSFICMAHLNCLVIYNRNDDMISLYHSQLRELLETKYIIDHQEKSNEIRSKLADYYWKLFIKAYCQCDRHGASNRNTRRTSIGSTFSLLNFDISSLLRCDDTVNFYRKLYYFLNTIILYEVCNDRKQRNNFILFIHSLPAYLTQYNVTSGDVEKLITLANDPNMCQQDIRVFLNRNHCEQTVCTTREDIYSKILSNWITELEPRRSNLNSSQITFFYTDVYSIFILLRLFVDLSFYDFVKATSDNLLVFVESVIKCMKPYVEANNRQSAATEDSTNEVFILYNLLKIHILKYVKSRIAIHYVKDGKLAEELLEVAASDSKLLLQFIQHKCSVSLSRYVSPVVSVLYNIFSDQGWVYFEFVENKKQQSLSRLFECVKRKLATINRTLHDELCQTASTCPKDNNDWGTVADGLSDDIDFATALNRLGVVYKSMNSWKFERDNFNLGTFTFFHEEAMKIAKVHGGVTSHLYAVFQGDLGRLYLNVAQRKKTVEKRSEYLNTSVTILMDARSNCIKGCGPNHPTVATLSLHLHYAHRLLSNDTNNTILEKCRDYLNEVIAIRTKANIGGDAIRKPQVELDKINRLLGLMI